MAEIGKEYGAALFMLAQDNDRIKEYGESLGWIRSALSEYPDCLSIISSPVIPLRERIGVIDAVFDAIVPEHILSYIKLLCEKGRISSFEDSYNEYMVLLNASMRVVHAKITSAVVLSDAEKEKLIQNLEKAYNVEVRPEYLLDSELLGGVFVEIDGKVMDGSLRRRLQEMKEMMYS